MVVKNVAIYAETFPVDSEGKAYVAPFTDKVKYDLKELAPDFYQIDPQGIYYEGAYQTYLQTSEFYQEGTHQLILDRDMFGSFTVYYRAYPEQITPDTDDEYELPIYIADTVEELAQVYHVTPSSIYTAVSLNKNGKRNGKWIILHE